MRSCGVHAFTTCTMTSQNSVSISAIFSRRYQSASDTLCYRSAFALASNKRLNSRLRAIHPRLYSRLDRWHVLPKKGNLLGFKVLAIVLQAGFDRCGLSPVALPPCTVYSVGRKFHHKISLIRFSRSAVIGLHPRASDAITNVRPRIWYPATFRTGKLAFRDQGYFPSLKCKIMNDHRLL